MDSEPKTKITTVKGHAVKVTLPNGTVIKVRRSRSGRAGKKTTVIVKSVDEITVTPIDERRAS